MIKGGATGLIGVDMSTPLSSGRYSFSSKNDLKIVRYTFWPSILSLCHPTFSGLAPPLAMIFQKWKLFLAHPVEDLMLLHFRDRIQDVAVGSDLKCPPGLLKSDKLIMTLWE